MKPPMGALNTAAIPAPPPAATMTRRKATGAFNQRDICQATGTTHLHGRSLRTEREAAADGDDAGDQFHKAHPQAHGH